MSDEKPTSGPTITFGQNENSTSAIPRTRSYKKLAIIAVCSIVTVAILLAAILAGMYLFSESQKDTVKLSLDMGKDSRMEVSADPNTNIVQFHESGRLYEAWIVDDFNRDIRVLKIQSASYGTDCYAAPLNRSQAFDPEQISSLSKNNGMKPNSTATIYYQPANTPILDFSFSSKTARDMCDGISTYWLYPRCEAQSSEGGMSERKKRSCWNFSLLWWLFDIGDC